MQLDRPARARDAHEFLQGAGWREADVVGEILRIVGLRRASSQCSQSRSRSGRMASRAQSESRSLRAITGAQTVQSVGATVAAMSAADRSSGPRSVSTHSGSVLDG